jgi:hypothetical protein
MSLIEDDSINGSVIGKTASDCSAEDLIRQRPKTTIRDRLIDYVLTHDKVQKGDLFIHISGSGSCNTILSGLIRAGIFVEHTFECGSCHWYSVNETKVNIA